ncbi:MAG: SpoIIIAH-like family protein [Bacilli bacterium]|nr:SpoIIIAH-like family protein [Mollicutes bacterium]MDY3898953.1 SpoIIIAH-like family protein [Bacilli bacterium]
MKKNQLALIFLTLVVMLAVWYIKSPLSAKKDAKPNDDNTTTVVASSRLESIRNMREAVTEERNASVVALDAIIASADSSLMEKELAFMQKKSLSNCTEKEVMLEGDIINMGYTDAFVHATDDSVEIIVIAEKEDALAALEIIQQAKESFINIDNLVVNFKTIEELSIN